MVFFIVTVILLNAQVACTEMSIDSPSMQSAPRTDVAALIHEMSSNDPLVRRAAANELGRNGPRAAPALKQLFTSMRQDDNFDVRVSAARAAWLIDPSDSQPADILDAELRGLLRGYGDVLRRAESTGEGAAFDALFETLRRFETVIRTLGEIGPAAAGSAATLVEILTRNLGDGYTDLAPRITHSLSEMGPAAMGVLPALEQFLATPQGKQNRSHVISAIAAIKGARQTTPAVDPLVDPDGH